MLTIVIIATIFTTPICYGNSPVSRGFAITDDSIFDPPGMSDKDLMANSREGKAPLRGGYNAGVIVTPVLAANDSVRSLSFHFGESSDMIQPALLGHASIGAEGSLAIVRYRPDGELDSSFFTSGIYTNNLSAGEDMIHSGIMFNSRVQYFVGRTIGTYPAMWMAGKIRDDSTSLLDTTFNSTGILTGTFNNGGEIFRGVTLSPGSTGVYAAGYSFAGSRFITVVARIFTDGVLDTAFNTVGFAGAVIGDSDSGALTIGRSTAGNNSNRAVAIGAAHNGTNWDFSMVRYMSDGTFDSSFSTSGKKTIGILASDDKAYAADADISNYELFVGGYASNGANNDFAIVKVDRYGNLDTTFNTTGKVTLDFSNTSDVVFSIRLDTTSNKLYAVGSTANANLDVAAARWSSDGVLDTAFHTDGKVSFDVAGGNDKGNAILNPSDYAAWKWVAASATNGGNLDFSLLRMHTNGLLAGAGQANLSFGTNGKLVLDVAGGNDILKGVHYKFKVSNNDDYITAVGNSGNDILVARYLFPNGTIDTSFFTDGFLTIDHGGTEQAANLYVKDNTDILIAGTNGSDFQVTRLLSTGELDTAFSTDGIDTVDFTGNDLAIAISTALVVTGQDGAVPSKFAFVKYSTDETGSLDTAFDTDGKVTYSPTGNAITVRAHLHSPSWKTQLFAAGNDTTDFVAIALKTDGSLNTTFNTDGAVTVDFGGTEVLGGITLNTASPRVMLVGGNGTDFCLSRITTHGNMDTSFDIDGKQTIDFGGASEIARGAYIFDKVSDKAIVVGDNGTDFLIARLLSDGTLDTTFNTTGKQTMDLQGNDTANAIIINNVGDLYIVGSSNSGADTAVGSINQ